MAKQRPLNPLAEKIRRDMTTRSAPQLGERFTGPQIFEPSGGWNNIPEIHEEPMRLKTPDGTAAQHRNFNAPFVGMLDNVDGGESYAETPVLESSFMGVDPNPVATPLRNAPMTSRSSLKPRGTRHGDASSTGNKHPL